MSDSSNVTLDCTQVIQLVLIVIFPLLIYITIFTLLLEFISLMDGNCYFLCLCNLNVYIVKCDFKTLIAKRPKDQRKCQQNKQG